VAGNGFVGCAGDVDGVWRCRESGFVELHEVHDGRRSCGIYGVFGAEFGAGVRVGDGGGTAGVLRYGGSAVLDGDFGGGVPKGLLKRRGLEGL